MAFLKTGFLQRLSNSKKEQEKEAGDSHESAFCMRYDIHSHILPGVDDGAKDLHMAVDMVRQAYGEGIRQIVATPHYTPGKQNSSVKTLQERLTMLQAAVADEFSDLKIYLGNEIFYSPSVIDGLDAGEIMMMPEGVAGMMDHTVLIEFAPGEAYSLIYDAVKRLTLYGYIPILAHVERYREIEAQNGYQELKEAGAQFQINAAGLKNGYQVQFTKTARKLIRDGRADYLGTDAHNTDNRKADTKEMTEYICKVCSAQYRDRLLCGPIQTF